MLTRKRLLQIGVIGIFVVGGVLIGVGTAGVGTPLVIAGVILIIGSGAAGFLTAVEHPASGNRPIFTSSASVAARRAA